MTRMLESEEAARRLGVKLPTLYAYVSRGLLVSHPSPDGRRSLFDLEDLEELSRRSRGARRTDARLATVTTAVTQLREDGPSYRGRRVVELARTAGFEDVAALLWDAEPLPPAQWQPAALPPSPALPSATRLQWAVVLCGARDPLRSDTRPAAVVQKARSLIASAVDALPVLGPRRAARGSAADRGAPLAARVARRYSTSPPRALVRAIDAALVLLADHELATSTLAVRLAASTRADLYDALLAGLATLAGPLHGGASELAWMLLADAERDGPERTLDAALRWRGSLPGFGHALYEAGDPRAECLLEHLDAVASGEQRRLVARVTELARAHGVAPPNIDLALAAIAWSAGLPADFGRTVFSIARLAGWTAHYLEELGERPLRFRARAVYEAPAARDGGPGSQHGDEGP